MAKGMIRVNRDDLITKLKAARAENDKKRQAAEKKALADNIESAKKEIARLEKFLKNPTINNHCHPVWQYRQNDDRYASALQMLELSVDEIIEYSLRSDEWYHISSLL